MHLAVGPKAALLVRAVETTVAGDSDDVPLAGRSAFDDVYAPSVSTSRRLTALATASTDIYRRAARLFLVLQEAALTDPAAAELASQAAARRLADHQRLATLLLPEGSAEQIADLADAIWALAGPSLYVELVHRRSWIDERYRQWLTGQLQQALRQSQKPPSHRRGSRSSLSG